MLISQATLWLIIGSTGQALFSARFLVQWIVSERKRDSVVPVAFWWLSLLGGLTLLSYVSYRQDPVMIVGQGMGLVVYVRNLMLAGKAKRRAIRRQRRSTANLLRLKSQEPLHGQANVVGAHQGFADQDG